MASANPSPQLDIFLDTRDVMLRNDLVAAIERCDVDATRVCAARLDAEFPGDHLLVPARLLADALEDDARDVGAVPSDPLLAAAQAVLGARAARTWLAPLWRAAARHRAQLPWHSAQSQDHAAPLWLAAGDWPQAVSSVGSIPSWRRIPEPLTWMTEARYRQDGLDPIWPLLAELAWLSPRRLHDLFVKLADPLIIRMRRRFDAEIDLADAGPHGELRWFPAWLLCAQPALAPLLAQAEAGQGSAPEQGLRLMVQLLLLEHQGRQHDLAARRKTLRELEPALFQAYMATR